MVSSNTTQLFNNPTSPAIHTDEASTGNAMLLLLLLLASRLLKYFQNSQMVCCYLQLH